MNIKETKLINCVEAINNANLGSLYFYDNVVVSEINEDAHVSLDVGEEHMELIQNHFGDKPFIYLSNRVNEFSTNAIDFEKFCNIFPNMKAFLTVYYNQFTYKSLFFEKQFCKTPYFDFKNLTEAYNYVSLYLLNQLNMIA